MRAGDRAILSHDVQVFLSNMDIISAAVSTQLSLTAHHLCVIAAPGTGLSTAELSGTAAALQHDASVALPADVQAAHLQLTHSFSLLLAAHSALLTAAIQALEQTQQGALARHTRSSAELLHARSVVLGLQAKIHSYSHAPPAEFVAALKQFRRAQGSGERALKDREALANRELELYERAGDKGMRDLAARKMWLVDEVQRVEAEIGKLEAERR